MDKNKLYKIYGNVLLGERFVSYSFKDEKGHDLGIIAGETIAKPYFKFFSKISDRTILIMPHTRKHVLQKLKRR